MIDVKAFRVRVMNRENRFFIRMSGKMLSRRTALLVPFRCITFHILVTVSNDDHIMPNFLSWYKFISLVLPFPTEGGVAHIFSWKVIHRWSGSRLGSRMHILQSVDSGGFLGITEMGHKALLLPFSCCWVFHCNFQCQMKSGHIALNCSRQDADLRQCLKDLI